VSNKMIYMPARSR